jgi:hypothetical protein
MANRTRTVFVLQMSDGARRLTPYEGFYGCGEATFSKTWQSLAFGRRTLRKIRGGHLNEATHRCLEDGNDYLVQEVSDCGQDYRKVYVGKFLKKTRRVEL